MSFKEDVAKKATNANVKQATKETPEQFTARLRQSGKQYEAQNYPKSGQLKPPPPLVRKTTTDLYRETSNIDISNTMRVAEENSQARFQNFTETQSQYNATFGDVAKASAITWANANPMVKTLGAFIDDNFNNSVDDTYVAGASRDAMLADLERRGISPSTENLDNLLRARNADNYEYRMGLMAKQDELSKWAASKLTTSMQGIAGFTGAVSDPTLYAYAPLAMFSRLRGGWQLAATMGANGALQYGLGEVRGYADSTRTAIDSYVDVAFGSILDGAIAYKMAKRNVDVSKGLPTKTEDQFTTTTTDNIATGHANTVKNIDALSLAPVQRYDYRKGYTFKVSPFTVEAITTAKTAAKTVAKALTSVDTYSGLLTELKAIPSKGLNGDRIATYQRVRNTMRQTVSELTAQIRGTTDEATKAELTSQLNKIRSIAQKENVKRIDKKFEATAKRTAPDKATHFARGKVMFDATISKLTETIRESVGSVKKLQDELAKVSNLKAEVLTARGLDADAVKARLTTIGTELKTLAKDTTPAGKAKLNALRDEANELLGTMRSPATESLQRQKDIYQHLASVVDEIVYEAQKAFDDMIIDATPTKAQRDTFVAEVRATLEEALGEKLPMRFDGDTLVIDKDVAFKVDDDGFAWLGQNKLKLATLLALSGSSAVMADDGQGGILSNIPTLIFWGIIGVAGVRVGRDLIKQHGSIGKVVSNMVDKVAASERIATIVSSPMGTKFEVIREATADTLNTGYINTYEWVMQHGNADSKALMQVLGFDALQPQSTMGALRQKYVLHHGNEKILNEALVKHYDEWLKETGQKEDMLESFHSMAHGTDLQQRFNEDVSYFREFGEDADHKFPPSVKAMAGVVGDILNRLLDLLQQKGVLGFTSKSVDSKRDTYMPHSALYDSWRLAVEYGGKEILVGKVANAIAKAQGKTSDEVIELAENLVNVYSKVRHFMDMDKSDIQSLLTAMEKQNIDLKGVTAEELAATIRGNNNAISRGQFRIEMDLREIGEITLKDHYGQDVVFNMNNLFDRRADSLVLGYSSQTAGAIAFKDATMGITIGGKTYEKGIDTEFGLRAIINKEPDNRSWEALNATLDNIMGRMAYDPTKSMERIVDGLKNVTNVDLALSTLSAGGEFMTASKHALFGGGKNVRGRFLEGLSLTLKSVADKPHSALLNKLMDFYGTGSAMARRDYTVRTGDAVTGTMDFMAGNAVEKTSQTIRAAALRISQNMRMDDFMKQIAMVYNTEILARLADSATVVTDKAGNKVVQWGNYRKSDSFLKGFGITPEFLERIKGKLVLDKDGDLVDFKPEDLDRATWQELNEIGYRMIQKDSPEEMLTSTPVEKHTSAAGRLLGVFSGFALQSYLSKGVHNFKYGGADSVLETLVYMSGLYAGLYTKELVKGNEPDQEEMMLNTLMMMPILAPVGVYDMATNPIALDILNQIGRQTGNIAEVAYPDDEDY